MAKNGHDNLIPNSQRSAEEVRENQRRGGIKSGETRRRKRDMRQCFEAMFKTAAPDKIKKGIEKQGLDIPDDLNLYEALTYSMYMRAMGGDARMVSLIMDVMGEKNSDKLKEKELKMREKELQRGRNEAIERLDSILEGLRNEAEADEETE